MAADAFNNLSDAGSSIVTFIGFKVSGKPADTGASVWTWKNRIHIGSYSCGGNYSNGC